MSNSKADDRKGRAQEAGELDRATGDVNEKIEDTIEKVREKVKDVTDR